MSSFTSISILLSVTAGLGLYELKHGTQLVEREIDRTVRMTAQAGRDVARLRTEWAVLNEPERLAGLAQRHLALRQLTPGQYVAMPEMGSRLPPPAAAAEPPPVLANALRVEASGIERR